jgi:hypothetical protein
MHRLDERNNSRSTSLRSCIFLNRSTHALQHLSSLGTDAYNIHHRSSIGTDAHNIHHRSSIGTDAHNIHHRSSIGTDAHNIHHRSSIGTDAVSYSELSENQEFPHAALQLPAQDAALMPRAAQAAKGVNDPNAGLKYTNEFKQKWKAGEILKLGYNVQGKPSLLTVPVA